jgi:hypothetical protein
VSKFQVVIISKKTDEVVKKFTKCASPSRAETLEDGVLINLNHNEYYTAINEVDD